MIGVNIYRFEELNSTNEYIKDNIESLKHGDVITAEQQSMGKGRFGNSWASKKGNLYFSFLLKKDIDRSNLFILHMRVSVAVIELLKSFGIEAHIKFPNDIIVNNKKICGILIESIGYIKISNLIVGVGININQTEFNNLAFKATSMALAKAQTFSIDEILNEFISYYNRELNKEDIYSEYVKNLKFLKKTIYYYGKEYEIIKVDITGKILLQSDSGTISIDYQEISLEDTY